MGSDERAGAGTGQPNTGQSQHAGSDRTRSGLARMGGYFFSAVLSAVALAAAALIVMALGGVAAPLPDRGVEVSEPMVLSAPAALPTVPDPVRSEISPTAPVPPAEGLTEEQQQQAEEELPELEDVAPQVAFSAWAARMSPATGISQRALQAYANAHAVMSVHHPECQLTWVTLAGIARIESNHGTIGGRTLGPDGRPLSPIIGIALDGSDGVRAIADTDGGLLDGDTTWDRAVGPFQFIPSTWALWATDGDGDELADPQDIDDSAVAAARYLCAGGRDLSVGEDWLRAVLSYNNSAEYVHAVYAASQEYGTRAQGIE